VSADKVNSFLFTRIFLQARKPIMKMIMLLMMLADGATPTSAAPDVQLLDFTASYCQPCQQMVPILQRMERDKFPVRQIDITEEHELARRFNVDRVPTLVLMVEGTEVRRFVGLTDEAELRSEMNKAARRLAESRGQKPANEVVEPVADTTPSEEEGETKTADATERTSIKDLFRKILPGAASGTSLERPQVRAQSPEDSAEPLKGLQAASAATVRVRVAGTSTKDGAKVQDVGTGTIVYSAEGQAIILTVAHVFLDIATENAKVEVEVFENGKPVPYPATLIGGDKDVDLAFLKIQTSKIMPSVRMTKLAPKVTKGQPLVSFGCNSGSDPTRLETKIVDINRYDGPANLVCTTDPESGRSGGGLFNAAGDLVGVCSCADRKRKEGLYMAHEPMMKLVNTLKLQSILMTPAGAVGEDASSSFSDLLAGKTPTEKTQASVKTEAGEVAKTDPPVFDESFDTDEEESVTPPESAIADSEELSDAPLFDAGASGHAEQVAEAANRLLASKSSGPKVTILIDDNTPGAQTKVIVIPQASPWMMELLTGESGETPVAAAAPAMKSAAEATSARSTTKPTTRNFRNRALSQAP
jgi:S1-C subfamily serine protease